MSPIRRFEKQEEMTKGKLIEENDFFRKLFKRFDKSLAGTLDSFNKTMNVSIQKVEKRLVHCENLVKKYVKKTLTKCEQELQLAEILVNKELRSKILMSQWTNKFLAVSDDERINPTTFAISRFSLNVAISFNEIDPRYIVECNIHKHLVDYISLKSLLAVGPAILALSHVSLLPLLKPEIVLAGALPVILKLMVHCSSKTILTQCAKVCASLALYEPNKVAMANSGCIHALYDLVLGAHQDVDLHVQHATMCAIVNVLYQSDANRLLSIELNGIKPILTLLRTSSHEKTLILGIRSLANISFGNPYTANCVLVGGGGEVLMELLEGTDVLRQPLITHAAFAALSNICNSDVNQAHVGSINGLIELAIRTVELGRDLYVVQEAANFLLAVSWKNVLNKAKVANKHGCTALVKRIIRHCNNPLTKEVIVCTEMLCVALATVLLYPSNHERMHAIGGLEEMIRLSKVLGEPVLLQAISKVIVTLVPDVEDLLRFHKDDNKFPVEKLGALPVLKKAKLKGYSHLAVAPDWLEKAIQLLSMSDQELHQVEGRWVKVEFVERLDYAKEFVQEIYPDATVYDTKEFRGLLFSIY